jgi:hypothetical protein
VPEPLILQGVHMRELNPNRSDIAEEKALDSSDRRRDRRVRSCRPVHIRPADPAHERFEDVQTMSNFSRNGFYFITRRPSYTKGMRLYVVPGLGVNGLEYLSEVVRFERLAVGWYGVGVRLLRVQDPAADPRFERAN